MLNKTNEDGSISVFTVVTNPDGIKSEIETRTYPDGTEKESVVVGSHLHNHLGKTVVSTTPVTSNDVIAKTPPFVATDKTQKFYEFKNANGKMVRKMYVNPTQSVEYFSDRLVNNLVVTDKSPLVNLLEITSKTNKMGKSIAKINFDTSVFAKSSVYFSTAPFKITLGIPTPVIVPNDAIKVESNNFAFNHSVEIYDLNAGTTYSYAIVTTDEFGNQNVTECDHFVTQGILNY